MKYLKMEIVETRTATKLVWDSILLSMLLKPFDTFDAPIKPKEASFAWNFLHHLSHKNKGKSDVQLLVYLGSGGFSFNVLELVHLVSTSSPQNEMGHYSDNDPAALEAMKNATFINSIDSPSLALLVPIVHRGLRQRSAETKKKAAQIMPVLMNTVIAFLASSSAERRQVTGRTLGKLVRKLGERVIPMIVPILADGLKDSSTSRRQGVCIGLSEVMASAGKNRFLSFMDQLIPTIRTALCDSTVEVRESAGLAFSTLYKLPVTCLFRSCVFDLFGRYKNNAIYQWGLPCMNWQVPNSYVTLVWLF